jgi:hypothetical protein
LKPFKLPGLGVLVSKVATRRFIGLFSILIVAVGIAPAAAGQAQPPPRSHAQGSLARAADATFRDGQEATLPPHISTLLGVSKEQELPVKQHVVRTGNLVQGFDVSVTNKSDIVLFVVDETTHDQNLYLTSPAGTLRKVVSVTAGIGQVVRIADKEQKAFEKETQFWTDRLVPSAAAK